MNELQQLLDESEQAAEVANKEYHDKNQIMEETIRQLTYSLEKVGYNINDIILYGN